MKSERPPPPRNSIPPEPPAPRRGSSGVNWAAKITELEAELTKERKVSAALREVGIALFLACVGLRSGGKFVETLVHGDGFYWMALAALITVIPLVIVGFVARLVYKTNFLTVCGLLAGSMTDPPALSFANSIASSDAPAITYATVYPLVMFLRILTAQGLVMFLAG